MWGLSEQCTIETTVLRWGMCVHCLITWWKLRNIDCWHSCALLECLSTGICTATTAIKFWDILTLRIVVTWGVCNEPTFNNLMSDSKTQVLNFNGIDHQVVSSSNFNTKNTQPKRFQLCIVGANQNGKSGRIWINMLNDLLCQSKAKVDRTLWKENVKNISRLSPHKCW
jgi:hypothetical protein